MFPKFYFQNNYQEGFSSMENQEDDHGGQSLGISRLAFPDVEPGLPCVHVEQYWESGDPAQSPSPTRVEKYVKGEWGQEDKQG
jgi:hypothetical protein